MNIDEAIQGMIDSTDYEVVFIGEQFWWHKDSYISELEHLGYSHEEAVNVLIKFCNHIVAQVEQGEDVTFPDYKEDLVALIAQHCRAGVQKAA